MQSPTWLDAYPFIDPALLSEAIARREQRWDEQLAAGSPPFVAERGGVIAGIVQDDAWELELRSRKAL